MLVTADNIATAAAPAPVAVAATVTATVEVTHRDAGVTLDPNRRRCPLGDILQPLAAFLQLLWPVYLELGRRKGGGGMPSCRFVATLLAAVVLPVLASEGQPEESKPTSAPVARQVWVADEIQCPLDPTKPWEFSDEQPHLHQVGGDISEPKAIFNPKPNIFEKEDFDPRTIPVVQAVINKDGIVERVGALRGSGPPLDAAVDAIKQWRFEPATLNGEPVCVVYIMTVFIHYQ